MTQQENIDEFKNEEDIQKDDELATEAVDEDCVKLRKNNKTLIAIVILLGGIAMGSFFVDSVQLFSQKGFSARAIKDAQVVEYDGNTWVRYDDPKIVVDVYDADDCVDCVTDEVLVRLRSLIPTLEAHRIDVRTDEGKQLAKNNNIKHIPAFIFSEDIVSSDFYQGAAVLFKEISDNKYFFEASNVGIPIGEYLEKPGIDTGMNTGNPDAKATIIVYTDFTCEMCKIVDPIINKIKKNFKDDVRIITKVTPDIDQKNAIKIAVAAQCAYKQDKFDEYSQILFNKQAILIKSDVVDDLLTRYSTKLKLDTKAFTECLGNENVKKSIEQNMAEASQFAVVDMPTLFINGQPHIGTITYENLFTEIKEILEPTVMDSSLEK